MKNKKKIMNFNTLGGNCVFSGSYKNRFGSTNTKLSTVKTFLIATMCIFAIKNANIGDQKRSFVKLWIMLI